MTTSNNIGAEWSVAYATSIKRLDSQFMLCLLRLMSWPRLGNMHGDLVDDLRLICDLLAKRPMVGFLVARRLKLPVDKTFALLNVLQSKGHLTALGVKTIDLDLNALEFVDGFYENGTSVDILVDSTYLVATKKTAPAASAGRGAQVLQRDANVQKPDAIGQVNSLMISEPGKAIEKLQSSGDVLNQLWRVLNTDIVMNKAARANHDPHAPVGKEAGEVLSQLWYVLNSDIKTKYGTVKNTAENTTTKPAENTTTKPAVNTGKSKKSNTTDAGIKSNAASKRHAGYEKAVRDVNGNIIAPDCADDHESKNDAAKDVMSQLWSVLNTDIAFKRRSGNETANEPSAEKTKEVAEVMNQLWRVLNTEIASNRQSNTKDGSESLSDTTREANDKLSKLWRILDAQIVLKKKSTTYLMTDNPLKVVKQEVGDTSGEAVNRLSQLWQILNSEIALAVPAESRPSAAKRRQAA